MSHAKSIAKCRTLNILAHPSCFYSTRILLCVQSGSKAYLFTGEEFYLITLIMVLFTSGRISRVDTLQQQLAANPTVQAGYNQPLEDIHHYKVLVQATIHAHSRMRNYWKEFAKVQDTPLDTEIKVGSVLPSLGGHGLIWKLMLFYLNSLQYRYPKGIYPMACPLHLWSSRWIHQPTFHTRLYTDIHGSLASLRHRHNP